MPDYIESDYFDTRLRAELLNSGGSLDGLSEYDRANSASNSKVDSLAAASARKVKELEIASNSWAGKATDFLGLDSDGRVGGLINVGAGIVETGAREAGQLVSAPLIARNTNDEALTSSAAIDAWNKERSGQPLTFEEKLLLAAKTNQPNYQGLRALVDSGASENKDNLNARQRLERMQAGREVIMGVKESTDLSSIVDPRGRNKLTSEGAAAWNDNIDQVKAGGRALMNGDITGALDALSGEAKIVRDGVSALVSNPWAVLELTAAQTPQIAMGAIGARGGALKGLGAALQGTSNVGYAGQHYTEGLQNYAKENNGALPPEAMRREMQAYSASLALAEQRGDSALLKGVLGGTDDLARAGFKNALLNTGKAYGSGFVKEGATEAWQTFAEGEALLKPVTGGEIFAGGLIGGVIGGNLSGAAKGLAELSSGAKDAADKAAQHAKNLELVKTGGISVLTEPTSENYNPLEGIRAITNINRDTATDGATKEKNIQTANSLLGALTQEATVSRSAYDLLAQGKEAVLAEAAKIDAFKSKLAENPEDPNTVAVLNNAIQIRETALALVDKKGALKQQEMVAVMAEEKLDEASLLHSELSTDSAKASIAEDKEDHFAIASAPVDVANTEAVAKAQKSVQVLINRSMSSYEGAGTLSSDQAENLALDLRNGLTTPQRDYLRAFSASRVAQNNLETTGSVRNTIFKGKAATGDQPGHLGISNYRRNIESALTAGDQGLATRQLDLLEKFATGHAEKARLSALAMEDSKKNNRRVQVINEKGQWRLVKPIETPLTYKEIEDNGGITADTNVPMSHTLIKSMQTEATALVALFKEKKAAYGLRFNIAPDATTSELLDTTGGIGSTSVTQAVDAALSPTSAVTPVAQTTAAPTSVTPVVSIQESVTTTLKNATRNNRLIGTVADPVAQDLLGMQSLPATLDLLSAEGLTSVAGVLGAGAGSIVLDTNLGALRMGVGPLANPVVSPNVNQVIKSGVVNGIRYEVFPKADTSNITDKDVADMTASLAAEGLVFSDPGTDNLGRVNGKLVVIDSGAVSKAKVAETTATSEGEAVAPVAEVVEAAVTPDIPSTPSPTETPNVKTTEAEQSESEETSEEIKDTTELKQEALFEVEQAILELEAEREQEAKNLKALYKEKKRLDNPRNSISLFTALSGALTPKDMIEIWGDGGLKKYFKLRKKGTDKNSEPLLRGMVGSGTLSAFLPEDLAMTLDNNLDNEQGDAEAQAYEFLVEKLREGNWLPTETVNALRKLDEDIENLEAHLDYLIEGLQDALSNQNKETESSAETEVDTESANSASVAEEVKDPEPEAATGDTASSTTEETGATEQANLVEKKPKFKSKGNGILGLFAKYREDLKGVADGMYLQFNLIAQYLKQSRLQKNAKSQKVLLEVKDFLTEWNTTDDPEFIQTLLGEEDGLSDEQYSALSSLKSTMNSWIEGLTGAFSKHTVLSTKEFDAWQEEQKAAKKDKTPDGKRVVARDKGSAFVLPDKFSIKDMMQYFYKEDTDIADTEENVKSAIMAAAYLAFADMKGSPDSNSTEDLVRMHQQGDGAQLTQEGYASLKGVSMFMDTAIHSMGKAAIQALGITHRDENTPLDLIPRLESALGSHALQLLIREGLVTLETKNAEQVHNYFYVWDAEQGRVPTAPLPDSVSNRTVLQYVQLNRNEKSLAFKKGEAIKAANAGSKSVITDLFGVDSHTRLASNTPSDYNQETRKSTNNKVPELQKEVLQATQQIPHRAIPQMLRMVELLGETAVLAIMGAIPGDKSTWHKSNHKSYQSKNDSLKREFDQVMETLNTHGQESPLYVKALAWLQGRAGFTDQGVNLQTVKLARYTFGRPSWTVDIDIKNEKDLNEFLVSVAMGMGSKTDQRLNAKTLEKEFTESNELNSEQSAFLFKDPEIMEAVTAVRRALTDDGESTTTLSPQEAFIIQKVSVGEGVMSLQALTAYAAYLDAVEAGKPSFNVTMLVGADGKTNGPMLTLLALGVAGFKTLAKGGMYSTDKGQANHFSEYFGEQGGNDLYQDTGANLIKYILKNTVDSTGLKAIEAILGEFTTPLTDGAFKVTSTLRNLMKTPITAFFFGSTIKKAVSGMHTDFIEKYAEQLETLKASEVDLDSTEESAEQYQKDFEAIMDKFNKVMLIGGAKESELLQHKNVDAALNAFLTAKQERALISGFDKAVGKFIKPVFKDKFEDLIDKRNHLNTMIQAAYTTYETIYTQARADKIQELMKTGVMPSVMLKDGLHPVRDLTIAEDAALKESLEKYLPKVHTALSKAEGDINAGITMEKSVLDKDGSSLYNSSVAMDFGGDRRVGEMHSRSFVYKSTAPGVAGTPYLIHSIDASIMHRALKKMKEALNVHDEISSSVLDVAASAQAINQATVEVLLEYSPFRESLDMFEKSVLALAKDVATGAVSPETAKVIMEAWAKLHKGVRSVTYLDAGSALHNIFTEEAHTADYARLSVIAKLKVMDQYTWEGGSFVVTQDIRDKAKAALKQLSAAPNKEVQEALKALVKALPKPEVKPKPVATPAATEEEIDTVVTSEGDVKLVSPYGELGQSAVESDSVLVDLFKQNGNKLTLAQALEAVGNSANPFYVKLAAALHKIAKTQNINVSVEMITPSTLDDLTKATAASRGWFVASTTDGVTLDKAIYVLSPEFKDSGLTEELLLHEVVHSILDGAVTRAQQSTSTQGAAKLVKELEVLRENAIKFAEKNTDLANEFKDALGDVHEFISWGMTNRKFQQEVLMKIPAKKEAVSKNKLITGMTDFIKSITSLLFNTFHPSEKDVGGMTLFVASVSGLLMDVSKNNAADDVVLATGLGTTLSNRSMTSPTARSNYKTTDIFDALDAKVSAPFGASLRGILKSIVEKVHGQNGSLKEEVMKDTSKNPLDIFIESLYSGKLPFASKLFVSGLKINDQEAFVAQQVEAVASNLLNNIAGPTWTVHSELIDLFNETRERLSPKDFHQGDYSKASAHEIADAERVYASIFNAQLDKNGRSDHLARFAALGLAHEGFNKLLQVPTKKSEKVFKDKTLFGVLKRLFGKMLDAINSRVTSTFKGQRADLKLKSLMDALVHIENKRVAALNATNPEWLDNLDELMSQKRETFRGALRGYANSPLGVNSKNLYLRTGAKIMNVYATDGHLKAFLTNLNTLRDKHFEGMHGFAAGVFTDLRGHKDYLQKLLRTTKGHDALRQKAIDMTNASVAAGFDANGEYLEDADKRAITKVLVHSGAHVLMPFFKMNEIADLVKDSKSLDAAIATFTGNLSGFVPKHFDFFTYQAKALGFNLSTGKVTIPWMLRNAHNIASMYGMPFENALSSAEHAVAKESIDVLATLYALKYANDTDKALLSAVMEREGQRKNANGVKLALLMHKELESESLDRLFEGKPTLMLKGYTSEIVNPNTKILVATMADRDQLEAQGYVLGDRVAVDPIDPAGAVKYLYVLRDGNLAPWVSAIMSLTSMRKRGTEHHGKHQKNITASMAGIKTAGVNATDMANFDPLTIAANYAVPVLNEDGGTANFVHLMAHSTKDAVLERDTRIDSVMGAHAGSIFDKENAPKHNKLAVEKLHEVFEAEYTKAPYSFLEVSATSPDPELRNIYRLLPASTKEAIRKVWGKDRMFVRADAARITFGYREMSLSSMYDKEKEERNWAESAFMMFTNSVLRGYAQSRLHLHGKDVDKYVAQAQIKVRRAENTWQALAHEVKDILVVKSGITLLGNVASNLTLLFLHKVPLIDIIRDTKVAWEGAEKYLEDNKKLFALENQLSSGYLVGDTSKIEAEIAELKDSLKSNPVRPLIEGGLMPSIVEDLADMEDPYSRKAEFRRNTKEFVDKINPHVRAVAKQLYLTHDTSMYKSMSHLTQLSDFTGRYVLYKHLTTRKEEAMVHEDAIQEASEAFVNYDIPLDKRLQYLDAMGFVPFTKYFLRVQKVIRDRFIDAPGRFVALATLQGYLDWLPSIITSSMFTRIGNNPLTLGAANYPFVLDDLLLMNVAKGVFN